MELVEEVRGEDTKHKTPEPEMPCPEAQHTTKITTQWLASLARAPSPDAPSSPPFVTPPPTVRTANRQNQFDAIQRHCLKLLWAGGCGGTALLHLASLLLLPPSRQPATVSGAYVLFACTRPLASVAILSIMDPLIGVRALWGACGILCDLVGRRVQGKRKTI